ncbi:ABC transporter B family member 1-like isoform X1 [Prosopis cineraria]|uniref:ABC transporter B family member 1-like isoform X1 n=1 Tax=Prosopis cineraria TaxID=364024 RepID=UPI00240EA151|nr:ABC transporter B family member 1-like isoform X1 [Prosopis cineraria]
MMERSRSLGVVDREDEFDDDEDQQESMIKSEVKALSFFKLLSYADAVDWILMALGALGSVVHGMAFPVGYLLLGMALNTFGNNINDSDAMARALKEKVVPYVWYMAIATFPAGILETGCWMYTSERQIARLRLAYLGAVLSQEIGAFDTELTSGKIISGISSHMSIIQDAIGEKLGHFTSCFATFFSGLVIAAYCTWEIALLCLVVVPLILLIGATYTKRMNNISTTKMNYQSQVTAMIEQTISQIKTVYAFVGEISAIKSFTENMDKLYIISKGESLLKGVGTGMFQTVSFVSWALIVWVGAVVVTAHRASGGDIITAVMSILFGAIYLTYAAPDMQIFNQAKAAGYEIFQVIQRKPLINNISEGKTPQKIEGSIELRHVHFSYPSRLEKPILQGFSLSIPAGKTVALVGSSGCGKSTVISLVSRFYEASKGEIFIDHHNIKDLDLKFLRRNIGAVSQEPSLFTGTIKDNLKVGKMDADDQEIQSAAEMSNAHSFISQLPDQYLTENGQVSEIGTHNSLLEASPFYNALFNMQNLEQVPDFRPSSSKYKTSTVRKEEYFEEIRSQENQLEMLEILTENSLKEEQIGRKERSIFFRIWYGLEKRELAKTAIGAFAAAFSGISKPVFGFYIITIGVAYFGHEAKQKVALYSVIFAAIGLLSLFSHTLQHYFFGIIGEKAMGNLRRSLYSGVLRNEVGWFDKPENSVGSLTSRIINDTTMVKIIIADRMSVIVQCISSVLIATVVSMVVNWRMGLVAWAVMPCHFIGGLVQAKSAKGFSGDNSAAHSELVALTSESTTNIRTVASFCHEEHVLRKAKASLDIPKKKYRIESIKYGIIQGFSIFLWNVAHAVALWYTAILVERRQSSFENGIRSYQIFSLTVPSITELYTLIPTVISAVNVLTPAFQTLDRKTEIEPDTPEDIEPKTIQGNIEFQGVKFNYPLRPGVNVLDNFSLKIKAGSKVAFVGPSGAGKSSVLALLLRFYDPREGKVVIDGKDIKDYNLRWLRKQMGLVQQEPMLFNCSIIENICYGNKEASESEIVEVSREANIHEFVSSLPNGYDTVVGEKGCQLSGGQKQRIAIARTLLKKPTILLLDEATSALDAESERTVISAMKAISQKGGNELHSRTTQITIAHRLSTVINSDTIVVMEKGKIMEMGSHSTLIESETGLYSRLFRLQSFEES